jgi:hypothetical protein
MADPTLTGATITFQTNDDVDALCGCPLDAPQERRTIESLPRHKRTMIAIRAPV